MKAVDIPTRIEVSFGESAVSPYIREIPIPSQIGITDGRASFTTGFPPDTFSPEAAGGIPPAGSDFNGILSRLSQWSRWQCAGGAVPWNAGFSSTVGGYPKGAIVASATAGQFWISTADDNTTDPDAAGAGWANMSVTDVGVLGGVLTGTLPNPGLSDTGVTPASYVRPQITVDVDGRVTAAANGAYPTRTTLTSGSGTYTTPANVKRLYIRIWGGGGGGGGTADGGTGGTTSINSITAIGGSPGGSVNNRQGGIGGSGGAGTASLRMRGAPGQSGGGIQAGAIAVDFRGGSGGGQGGGPAGTAAAANTGGGGGGLTAAGTGNQGWAGGGGQGEYAEIIINNPGVSYAYAVGAGGTAGTAGGGAGGSGIIIIDEFYD